MRLTHDMQLVTLILMGVFSSAMAALAGPIEQAFPDPTEARGVVLVSGLEQAEPIIKLAKASPTVILVVVQDDDALRRMDAALRQAGVSGQVTVAKVSADGRVPLADNTAATSIVDTDADPKLGEAEVRRVTRPFGRILIGKRGRWAESVKSRPKGMDDWTHYNSDARNSQHSDDTHVGPPRGLQWIAGPTNDLDYLLIHEDVVIGLIRDQDEAVNDQHLIARDAFTGLPIWEKPGLRPNNRFSMVLDDGKLYIHPLLARHRLADHTQVFDARTGRKLREFDQGLNFHVPEEVIKKDRNALKRQRSRADDLQLRLSDQSPKVLLQVIRGRMAALDVESGERLWSRDAPEGHTYASPTIGGGRVYIVSGPEQRWSAYTHWPMSRPKALFALDLRSGKEVWRLDWDEQKFVKPHAVYNLEYRDGLLTAAVTGYIPTLKKDANRPRGHGLILDAKTGDVKYFGREKEAWPGTTGHGHSHVRLHLRDGKLWTLALGGPRAFWPIDRPQQVTDFGKVWKERGVNMRPVSCTVWRSTPTHWIGGLGMYPLDDQGQVYFNRSGRSNCDIGALPANGMLYSPPNTCQCQPYLPGTKTYHSREVGDPVPEAQRLVRGSAKPAGASNDDGVKKQWPQWAGSPERRFWSKQQIPTDLRPVWRVKTDAATPPKLLAQQWRVDAVLRGPITSATVAEGVVVFAEHHAQAVVALDADTGKRKWRTPVDGRVDLAPTIYKGVVVFGTRNGYAYGLNRETGEVVWRFMAAPLEERIMVNGQLESPWPVFGAVPVDARGAMVVAGRHTSSDGGMWWWQLDPFTGEVLGRGRLNDGQGVYQAANWVDKLPVHQRPIQNTVAVMGDDYFQLVGPPVRRAADGLDATGEAATPKPDQFLEWEPFEAEQRRHKLIRSGRNAIIGERQQTVGGYRKPRYANTLARLFAIDPASDSDRFVCVGGGPMTARGRGEGGGSNVHLMRYLEKPVIEQKPRYHRYADPVWEHNEKLLLSRGNPAVSALAVSDNAVFLGLSILGPESGREYREARAQMPHRLRILDLNTGRFIRDLPLPGHPLQGGVALADGRVYVATDDGSITAFAAE